MALLSALGGLAMFLFFLSLLGELPGQSLEARHLREMKDRLAAPGRVEPITHAAFLALPERLPVAEYSAIERRAVSMVGEVHAMIRASDGDFHLEFFPVPDTGAVDLRWLTAEITPGWRGSLARRGIDSPGWGFDRLLAVFRPNRGGPTSWEQGPARVRLSGWLLYDGLDGRIQERLPLVGRVRRATEWEIHPVTKIERWDDARTAWVEVAR